jgi:hypothetical protein
MAASQGSGSGRRSALCLVVPIVLVVVLLCSPGQFYAAAQGWDDGSQESVEEEQVPRVKPFKGYRALREQFALMGRYVELDGRLLSWRSMLEAGNVRDPQCRACKVLFLELLSAAPKLKQKEKPLRPGASPTPSPARIFLQREPCTELIDTVLRAFRILADDEKYIEDHYPALLKLLSFLRNPAGKSQAEREYFETLATFIEEPFLEYRRQLAAQGKRGGVTSPVDVGASIDQLFGD